MGWTHGPDGVGETRSPEEIDVAPGIQLRVIVMP